MICAGIDAGSRAIKIVLFDAARQEVLARQLADQGVAQTRLASDLYRATLDEAKVAQKSVAAVVATGYGRGNVPFADTTITEITCHARGVHHVAPQARTVIEVGGQDSKLIRLDPDGQVRDFAMNDRCAAGTGRFLEMVAARLGLDWPALEELARTSRNPALISSTCVVFAETEIIGLLAEGIPAADIAAGVQQAIATRVSGMVGRTLDEPIYFTGGVALHAGMTRALEQALSCPVRVAPSPQYTGALGAAILAVARQSRPSGPGG